MESGVDEVASALIEWHREAHVARRLSGGTRNNVYEVDIRGERHVARRSSRSPAALDWELNMLDDLREHDFEVPHTVPASGGARTVDGVIVYRWIEGRPPDSSDEWQAVATELARLHEIGRDWPQRPEFRSTVELVHEERGGDVRLDRMPPDVVERCRDAWRGIADEAVSLVHGDPRGNTLITSGGVALIDWDEARVDASILDVADLPVDPTGIEPTRLAAARRAAHAWEAAVFWLESPMYARRRFAQLI